MKLQHNKLWLAIGLGITSGSALADPASAQPPCTIIPGHSVITAGQTLQLQATCTDALKSVEWKLGEASLTGKIMGEFAGGTPVAYTTPIGLGASANQFDFTFVGVTDSDTELSATARVVVQAGSTAAAAAGGVSNPMTPVDAQCGTGVNAPRATMPGAVEQCAAGSKPALAISGPYSFSWSCISLTGGAEASCYVARSDATPPTNPPPTNPPPTNPPPTNPPPTNPPPTNPPPTNPPPIAPGQDPGIGGGLWVPSSMPNRTVADQSGGAVDKVSYVPGCLNGEMAKNSSTGCAAKNSFESVLAGTATWHTVLLGGTGKANSGKQLVLRYKSTPTAGQSPKYIRARSYDGGNVGVNMRVWLSTDPTATYAGVPDACKQTSARTPAVVTGPGYCPIAPNTVYYFGIEYDETGANRFQIEESAADFL